MLPIQKNLRNSFYAMLSLPATAMGFALSIQIAALSWLMSTKYNLEIHEVGLVWAAGPIAGILGQVIIGIISDNVWFWNGRRRPFILIGGVLAALMLLALPNIDIISVSMGVEGILGVAIAVALTLDLAINVSFNPTRAIIADVTPEGVERTKGYSWMQTISGTFGVMAYFIGAIWNNYALIYIGVGLVFLFSVIPPLFIEEPRKLSASQTGGDQKTASLWEVLRSVEPLWGFLIYNIYAIYLHLAGIEVTHYYVEMACAFLTLLLLIKTFIAKEDPLKPESGYVSFKKILAAHSFTWLGVQTMFVYMYAYLQYNFAGLGDDALGFRINISFLVLNAVAAILPVLVLEPATEKFGKVKTHLACISIMAVGYAAMWFAGKTQVSIYVLMGVIGIGWAATISIVFAIMSQRVEQTKMGLYMGLFNLAVVLPQLVVSLSTLR